jgi:hypothetical protein
VLDGLRLTAYFMERHIFSPRSVPMPSSRLALQERLGQAVAA